MKKLVFTVIMGALAGLAVAQGPLIVQDQADVGVTGEIGLYSHYVWRGQIYDDSVVQPSLTVTKGPVSLNIWGNYNLAGKDGREDNDLTETDFTLSLRVPDTTDDFDIDIGIIKYTYTAVDGASLDADTEELFISAIFHNIILTPVAALYYDLDANQGWYASLGLSQAVEISDALAAEAGASIGLADGGYNKANYSTTTDTVRGGGANDYNVWLETSYAITEDITVGAKIQYTILDDKIDDGARAANRSDNAIWGGLSVSYTF